MILQEIELPELQQCCNWTLKFSLDSAYMSIGGVRGKIYIYNLRKASKSFMLPSPDPILHGHDQAITDLSWNSEGLLLSSSADRNAILWNIAKEEPLNIFAHPDSITACKFFTNSPQHFATACKDNLIRLYEVSALKPLGFYQLPVNATCMEFSADGKVLAVGLMKGEVLVYNVRTDCRLRVCNKILCRNSRGIYSGGRKVVGVSFTQKGLLLVSTADSRIRMLGCEGGGGRLVQKFKGHKNLGSGIPVQYLEESEWVMSGSEDGRIYFWNFNKDVVKNICYKQIEPRTKRYSEYSVFAPKRIVENISSRYEGAIDFAVFTIGAKNKLSVLLILSNMI